MTHARTQHVDSTAQYTLAIELWRWSFLIPLWAQWRRAVRAS